MSQRISCSGCRAQYNLPSNVTKSAVRCKRCGETIRLRTPASAGTATRQKTTGSHATTAEAAVRSRSRRTQTALGMTTKRSLDPVHLLTGVLSVAALVAIIVFVAL